MEKQELLDLFNLLSDRDIACFLYTRILNCPHKEVSAYRNLSVGQVKFSSQKINKALNHDELIAALQEAFFDDSTFC
jgi:hypothetical protein